MKFGAQFEPFWIAQNKSGLKAKRTKLPDKKEGDETGAKSVGPSGWQTEFKLLCSRGFRSFWIDSVRFLLDFKLGYM